MRRTTPHTTGGEPSAEPAAGSHTRRRFLQVSGAWIVSAAVMAACDRHSGTAPQPGPSATSTSEPGTSTTPPTIASLPDLGRAVDILILRTASSLEHYAVGLYTEVAGLDVVSTGSLLESLKYFADQHSVHASAFEQATGRAGGRPFNEPNRVLSQAASAQLAGLKTEQDVLKVLYDVETLLAATHVATVGELDDRGLNGMIMGVGAVEARHVAVIGMHLSGSPPASGSPWPPYPPGGFASVTGSVPAGVGIS
jgi:hypothetical protein